MKLRRKQIREAGANSPSLLILMSSLLFFAPVANAGECAPSPIKPNEELHLSQKAENITANVRIGSDFIVADLSVQHISLVAQAPLWTVQAISRKKGIYCETSLSEWLRRGSPLNFFRATEIPQWPLLLKGDTQFLHHKAKIMALPYLDKQHHVVPLKSGSSGHLIVLDEGLPLNAARIMGTLFQTPKSDLYPLRLFVGWQTHQRRDAKVNDVFLFCGGKEGPQTILDTTQLTVEQRHELPGVAGLRLSKDQGSLWADASDLDGIQQLMK